MITEQDKNPDEGDKNPDEGDKNPEDKNPDEGDKNPDEGDKNPEDKNPDEGDKNPEDKNPDEGDKNPDEGDKKPEDKNPDEGDKNPEDKNPDEGDKNPDEGDKNPEDKNPDEGDKNPDEGDKNPEDKKPEEEDKKPEEEDKKPEEEDKKPEEEDKKPEEEDKKPEEEDKKPEEEDKKPQMVPYSEPNSEVVTAELWEIMKHHKRRASTYKDMSIHSGHEGKTWKELPKEVREDYNERCSFAVWEVWEKNNNKVKENNPKVYKNVLKAVEKLTDFFINKAQALPKWQNLEGKEEILKRMHPRNLEEEEKRKNMEVGDLSTDEQFTYDYAIVFRCLANPKKEENMSDEDLQKKVDEYREEMSKIARIIDYFVFSDLKFKLYKGENDDKIICLLGASEKRLRKEADRIHFDVLLNRQKIVDLGNKLDHPLPLTLKIANIKEDEDDDGDEDKDEFALFTEDLYKNTYGIFKEFKEIKEGKNVEDTIKMSIYHRYNDTPYRKNSFFSELARLQLTKAIIEAETHHDGGDLRLAAFSRDDKHPAIGFFAMHEPADRLKLQNKFSECCSVLKDTCCCQREEIEGDSAPEWMISSFHSKMHWMLRDYFGESVALYFTYLTHYTMWLLPISIIGIFCMIPQLINWAQNKGSLNEANFFFGILMIIWAMLFLENWKRVQAGLSACWGTTHFEDKETIRPEFEGQWKISLTTGLKVETENFFIHILRICCSQSVVVLFISIVIALVILLLMMKLQLILNNPPPSFIPTIVPPLVNAVTITILNFMFRWISSKLNDLENHRTESQFENAKISKTFLFKFINSYNSLFIIAFFKRNLGGLGFCKNSYFSYWKSLFGSKCAEYKCSYTENAGMNCEPRVGMDKLKKLECFLKLGFEPIDKTPGTWTTNPIHLPVFGTPPGSQQQLGDSGKIAKGLNKVMNGSYSYAGACENWKIWKDVNVNEACGASTFGSTLCDNACKIRSVLVDPHRSYTYKGDCFFELSIQLLILFLTQLFLNNVLEVGIPYIKNKYEFNKLEEENKELTVPEKEMIYKQYEGTFADYDEMIVQFGYVTMFVVAFPAAPFFAFLNNCFEFRVDGSKLTSLTRRPYPQGAQDIGTWFTILNVLTVISCITNSALLILFPSNVIPKLDNETRFVVFLILEHSLITIIVLVSRFVSDKPQWVEDHLNRQEFTTTILIGR